MSSIRVDRHYKAIVIIRDVGYIANVGLQPVLMNVFIQAQEGLLYVNHTSVELGKVKASYGYVADLSNW